MYLLFTGLSLLVKYKYKKNPHTHMTMSVIFEATADHFNCLVSVELCLSVSVWCVPWWDLTIRYASCDGDVVPSLFQLYLVVSRKKITDHCRVGVCVYLFNYFHSYEFAVMIQRYSRQHHSSPLSAINTLLLSVSFKPMLVYFAIVLHMLTL